MHDDVARAIGRVLADPGGRVERFHTRLTELGPRLGGSAGERRAADLVVDAFDDAGLGPTLQSFEVNAWTRGSAELAIRAERTLGDGGGGGGGGGTAAETVERAFETVALPYSPAGEVRGELVDAGYGTPDEIDDLDVRGKVVVASTTTPPEAGRFVHRMEKYGHAAIAGADAFVFANHVPGQLPPTGSLRFDAEGAIPGVGVSKETGAWLADYADLGAEAHVTVDATTESGSSQNVVGTIGGGKGADGASGADAAGTDEVVLVAHYDAHDIAEGALDNGCGIATVVAALPVLRAMALDCRVRVAAVGCEETGLMGAEALADTLDTDRVRAVVNVDGAGRARNLKAFTHAHDGVESVVRDAVEGAGQPLAVETDPHPYSDHWPFLRAGVPALQLHSESPDGPERGRGWGHTHADTRDKVDYRDVREHAVLTALVVRALTHADPDDLPRVDDADLADALREADAEKGMQAAGLWPDDW